MDEDDSFESYFQLIEKKFSEVYSIASNARAIGLDPELEPESRVTKDLAERVEKSVGPEGVAERIRSLSKVMPREEVAFKISEEIVGSSLQENNISTADQAVRTALAILGEGVTVAPIQGIVKIDEKINPDGTRHLSIYFAGPIRSAGGTEMALTIIIADFIRQLLGLDRYKATEEEAKRFLEELRIYEREVARFQYKFPDDLVYNAIIRLPVEVTGVETNHVEVPTFRNLKRVETNRVRGGALRVLNDGILGRANKVIKIIDKLGISGWEWLKDIREGFKNSEASGDSMFMEDVIAGRPVFSFPSMERGFRLRYGRSRDTGLASYGVHPSTMKILRGFMATGTQIRLEKPGKAGIVVPVDTIEPSIIKLKDGSTVRSDEISERTAKESIEKILFLGDILVGFGEFIENNKHLDPPGYVEEWWAEELKSKLVGENSKRICNEAGISEDRLTRFLSEPFKTKPNLDEAFKLSQILRIPLHPCHVYFWDLVKPQEILLLREKIANAVNKEDDKKEIRITEEEKVKTLLEKMCVPHNSEEGYLIFKREEALILKKILTSSPFKSEDANNYQSSLELLKALSGVEIRAKGGTFIGARMGRPEKARPREMRPLVHVLFPIGLAGGSRRNLIEAANSERISTEMVNRFCSTCQTEEFSSICIKCGSKTLIKYVCPTCSFESMEDGLCPKCRVSLSSHSRRYLNLNNFISMARERLGLVDLPDIIKAVKGLTNELKIPEPLEKGILRSVLGLSLFKDGTIRFDSTNAVLSHFKPSEIGLNIDEALWLGYTHDYKGEPLKDPEQICVLKLQDIIVPKSCGEYLLRVSRFIDELLVKFYKLPSFYNAHKKEELLGRLVVGLSPHTSVGVIGRIIGYSDTNVCFAHPIWHAAKRRDCDGDEDSISLALDILLNFSKKYLPSKIGGLMDAPLLMTVRILPTEVARQAFNIEAVWRFPLQFYEASLNGMDSKDVAEYVELVYPRLYTTKQFDNIPFTNDTTNINKGNHKNAYSELPTMIDKVNEQLELADAISAVDAREVAKKVVSTHFMRDLAGNLKAYSGQKVRCKKCNAKYRRIPLKGKCFKCKGELSLTVYRGSVEKYLEIARRIIQKYNTGEYHEQRLKLIANEINSLFKDKLNSEISINGYEQRGLSDFM